MILIKLFFRVFRRKPRQASCMDGEESSVVVPVDRGDAPRIITSGMMESLACSKCFAPPEESSAPFLFPRQCPFPTIHRDANAITHVPPSPSLCQYDHPPSPTCYHVSAVISHTRTFPSRVEYHRHTVQFTSTNRVFEDLALVHYHLYLIANRPSVCLCLDLNASIV